VISRCWVGGRGDGWLIHVRVRRCGAGSRCASQRCRPRLLGGMARQLRGRRRRAAPAPDQITIHRQQVLAGGRKPPGGGAVARRRADAGSRERGGARRSRCKNEKDPPARSESRRYANSGPTPCARLRSRLDHVVQVGRRLRQGPDHRSERLAAAAHARIPLESSTATSARGQGAGLGGGGHDRGTSSAWSRHPPESTSARTSAPRARRWQRASAASFPNTSHDPRLGQHDAPRKSAPQCAPCCRRVRDPGASIPAVPSPSGSPPSA
jgi:hypothetical protein